MTLRFRHLALLSAGTLLVGGCDFSAATRLQAVETLVSNQVSEAISALKSRPRTADTADRFDFVVIGDSRGGLDVLRRQMAEIDKLDPAFVIYTGDLVGEGTEQEYREGVAALKLVRAPVFPAVGNHERRNGGIKWYHELFGKDLDYSFDYGNWRFVGLDDSMGGVSAEQLAWLQVKLQTPKRKVVFAHMPPPLGIWWVHPFRGNYKAYLATVEAAKVDACVYGHIHIFDKAERNGIRHLVSGGGGAPLYRIPIFNSREGGAFYNYVVGHVSSEGVSFEVRKTKGIAPTFAEGETDEFTGEEIPVNDF